MPEQLCNFGGELFFATNAFGNGRVASTNKNIHAFWKKAFPMKIPALPLQEIRFGFAGPDDRVVSLNVPAANEDGRMHAFSSFEIEFDPEQPDKLVISLFETNEDDFIRTVRQSIPFPAEHLAELLSQRKATDEEILSWKTASDEDE